ncbi:rhomboid family intramembrane serine protease [Campylobacter sp. LR264d]|uniref:rhomboid family intramembrane serine protease n=1 Tax=Campylobacter sp. LR264d TaxID=2593544 RepID=UPI00123B75D3|nr:rhomboid family intramembrane serine protease [Campylobacter sp. LR264d]KAA6233786.1 rhomboid family intramembrane serine protease [Campylobacter sp. LR264d]
MLTNFIILINVLIYIFMLFYDDEFYVLLGLNILFFKANFFWQVLSTMFVHGNFMHLFVNMVVLFQFGRILEKFLGSLKFCFLYFVGGLLCSFLSAFYVLFDYNFFLQSTNLVGASGAICVLIGAFAAIDKESLKGLIIAVLLMSFAPLLMGINVAWYGHIFGFVCGYLLVKFYIKGKR